jgi:hypothetical protein
VTAPDHRRAGLPHRIDQSRRLRIVEDHDVPRSDERHELGGVLGQRPLVDRSVGLAQAAPVAVEAVELVVDALGDVEERRSSREHEPAGVDAGAA